MAHSISHKRTRCTFVHTTLTHKQCASSSVSLASPEQESSSTNLCASQPASLNTCTTLHHRDAKACQTERTHMREDSHVTYPPIHSGTSPSDLPMHTSFCRLEKKEAIEQIEIVLTQSTPTQAVGGKKTVLHVPNT